jgi:hypothetical protein
MNKEVVVARRIHGRLGEAMVCAIALAAAGAGGLTADPAPAPLPADLEVLPREPALFLSLRLGDLWSSDHARTLRQCTRDPRARVFTAMKEPLGIDSLGDVERVVQVLDRDEVGGMALTLRVPLKEKALREEFGEGPQLRLGGRKYFRGEKEWFGLLFLNDRSVVIGPAEWIEEFPERVQRKAPDAVLRAAQEHALAVAVRPDRPSRITDALREYLGKREDLRPLLEVRDVLITADASAVLVLEVTLSFADAAAAGRACQALEALRAPAAEWLAACCPALGRPGEEQALTEMVESFRSRTVAALRAAKVHRAGETLRLSLRFLCPEASGGLLAVLLNAPWGNEAPPPAGKPDEDRVAKVARALLAYHDTHGRLPPPDLRGRDGTPLLSWRVAILPQLGEQKGTLFEGPGGVSLKGVPAGKVLLAEAATAVPWTKPEELSLAANGSLGDLRLTPRFRIAYADGTADWVHTGLELYGIEQGEVAQFGWKTREGPEAAERRELFRAAVNGGGITPEDRRRLAQEPAGNRK